MNLTLPQFCEKHSLPWSKEIEKKVEQYVDLILKYNKTMNLIGPMNSEEIKVNLFIDSLVAAIVKIPNGKVLDVGSGAGIPGIVFSIFYPEIQLTLVEPRRKRADFLQMAVRELGISSAIVFQKRIEVIPQTLYDYVIAKAFRKPVEWLPLAANWIHEEGAVLCMHTTDADLSTQVLTLEKTLSHEALDLQISNRPRAVSLFTK